MSLLEAPCAKTSWRALLFRAILGITGALIVCFDIWWFKQVNNSETGFSGHHCDFEQHVPCLAVHVCMNSVKFVLKAPGASILWGRYYSVIMCRLIWGALLLGGALLIGTLRYFHFDKVGRTSCLINKWLGICQPVRFSFRYTPCALLDSSCSLRSLRFSSSSHTICLDAEKKKLLFA